MRSEGEGLIDAVERAHVLPGPIGRDAIATLKEEAENAPDMPGSADWGRKAVLRLIASHEALRAEPLGTTETTERRCSIMNDCIHHRFKLAGYRDRPRNQTTARDHTEPFILMDAVLVCLRCPAEKLVGITHKAPAPIEDMPEPVSAASGYGHCGLCGVPLNYHDFIQGEVDGGRITKAQADDCRAKHHKPGCFHALTPFWRLARWGSGGPPHSWYRPMPSGPNDVAYWASQSPEDFQHCDALATIVKVLQHCEDHPPRDPGVVLAPGVVLPQGDLDTIHNQVYALRAYIAGLERRP